MKPEWIYDGTPEDIWNEYQRRQSIMKLSMLLAGALFLGATLWVWWELSSVF